MTLRYVLVLMIITVMSSCSEDLQKPKELISEDKYINLLVELQLVRSLGETSTADSLTVDSLTSEVFTRYGVSNEEFSTSHQYYQQFPKEQQIRVEKAIERLQMDQVSNLPKDTTSQN